MPHLDFAPNYAHVIELDITPEAAEPTWANALRGISNCVPTPNETVSEDTYYHNLGNGNDDVTAVKLQIAMTGHRMYGDPVQDYVASLMLETGSKRNTRFRWTQPDGTYIKGQCAIRDLVPAGMGDSDSKGDFSYTISVSSIEEFEPGDKLDLPESVTATAVSVTVGGTSKVSPTVTPPGASPLCHFAIEDDSIATVDTEGNVKGAKAGKTTLSIKCASKPSVMVQIDVTVTSGSGSQTN